MTSARITGTRFGVLWLVALALIAGLVLMGFGRVRPGGFVVAGTLVAAAILRLTLPRGPAGGLVVRSRPVDVVFLLGMGVGLLVIVSTLDLRPRR